MRIRTVVCYAAIGRSGFSHAAILHLNTRQRLETQNILLLPLLCFNFLAIDKTLFKLPVAET